MSRLVYDASVLVAADRGDRRGTYRAASARARSGSSQPFSAAGATQAVSGRVSYRAARRTRCSRGGRLLGISGTTDVVDASVVAIAIRCQAIIITGDVEDMKRLAAVAHARVSVVGL